MKLETRTEISWIFKIPCFASVTIWFKAAVIFIPILWNVLEIYDF